MKPLFLNLILALVVTACQPGATSVPATSSVTETIPTPLQPDSVPATLDPFLVLTATPPAPATGTPTEVPPVTRLSSSDGMPQVFIPEGALRMGGLDVHAENDEVPDHIVSMHAFWIDQLEVTNGMYALCVQAGTCRLPQKTSSPSRASYFDNPEFKDYPVMQIAWADARAYCEWAGRRLPSEAEWERAARGDDLRTYPWGDEPPSERYANFSNLIRDTSRVGSYAAGASPFGVLDMAGNVWEWTADLYDGDYYLTSPERNPTGGSESDGRYQRVIRGGSFQDVATDLRVSNRGFELGPNPSAAFGSLDVIGRSSVKIGFRCASDP
jgi:formylglycine-generating enzyme required for sulfatase activity